MDALGEREHHARRQPGRGDFATAIPHRSRTEGAAVAGGGPCVCVFGFGMALQHACSRSAVLSSRASIVESATRALVGSSPTTKSRGRGSVADETTDPRCLRAAMGGPATQSELKPTSIHVPLPCVGILAGWSRSIERAFG